MVALGCVDDDGVHPSRPTAAPGGPALHADARRRPRLTAAVVIVVELRGFEPLTF